MQIDTGTTSWMLMSTTLVLLMVPGLAIFYGGLVRAKNVLGTMMHCFSAMAVIGVLWVIIGYSMSFGENVLGGWFGWNSDYFLLQGLNEKVMDAGIPELVFAMFQGKFSIITPAIIAGALAERIKFKGYILFIILWSILVYNPICHWVWAEDGFLFNLGAKGAIDFAGGTVVHISAGVSGLVAALFIGTRHDYRKAVFNPNSLVLTLLGCGLLWVGWFGFNAGSSLSSGLDTARALTVTQIAAASGALSWMIVEAVHHKKVTSAGLASGILSGLVVITPAAGVVTAGGALLLGALASMVCYLAIIMKDKLGYDDSLDAFGIHGIAGIFGAIFLVFFVRNTWMQEAGTTAGRTWGVWDQLLVQVTAVLITILYSAVFTLAIVYVVEKTVGLKLNEEDQKAGMDEAIHGEYGYRIHS
ncbi:MAG: ammonium transporter [Oligoflexia bacterium]|nr:ammonium transporter [Oligoflexia bacterium]